MVRLILATMLAVSLSACGADTLLQSSDARRAEIEAAVTDVLRAEKGWQTEFIERRTETMMVEQKENAARTQEIALRMKAFEDRLDDIARKVPSVADPGFGRSRPTAAQTAPPPVVDTAEMVALRRDLDAMTGAVAQLLAQREGADAEVRARFERLELRTSTLAWPESDGSRGVHLASYKTHEAALGGWEVLQSRYRSAFGSEPPTFIEVEAVAGRFVRLFVGVGLSEREMLTIRDIVRRGGDYAMVLPLPSVPES